MAKTFFIPNKESILGQQEVQTSLPERTGRL